MSSRHYRNSRPPSENIPLNNVPNGHLQGRDPLLNTEDEQWQETSLGKSGRKKMMDRIDGLAVLASLVLLALAVLVITPKLSWAWYLGYDHQLIVIGLLLGAMNLCLRRIAPAVFLIIEHHFRGSRLQNYDAILRNTILLSQTSFMWRIVMFLLLCLPIGLSVAYKKFTGGQSSSIITTDFPGNYSITTPPLQAYSRMNNSVYFMIDAIAPFMIAAGNDAVSPNSTDSPNSTVSLPAPYGYNILLLDGTSAASLDMPNPEYVLSIQQNLTKNEIWTISASVGGTVAMQATLTDDTRDNDTYWQDIFNWSNKTAGDGGLTTFNTFDHSYDIGFVTGQPNSVTGAPCYLGAYQNGSTRLEALWMDATAKESLLFRQTALMFNVRRMQCYSIWQINSTNIKLVGGNCTDDSIDQTVLLTQTDPNGNPTNGNAPLTMDVLPVLVHILEIYTGGGLASPWRIPAYAVSVATAYWARLAFLIPIGGVAAGADSVNYPAKMEHITSTRNTMDATWPLYIVLAFQPLLIVLFFLFTMMFSSSPIGKGFGMVAVLSGIDADKLHIIKGATLSGETKEPISLGIAVVEATEGEADNPRIQYRLNDLPNDEAFVRPGYQYS
ncbi:hypothetical protein BDR22DRAFT_813333 [Usnea florida]